MIENKISNYFVKAMNAIRGDLAFGTGINDHRMNVGEVKGLQKKLRVAPGL